MDSGARLFRRRPFPRSSTCAARSRVPRPNCPSCTLGIWSRSDARPGGGNTCPESWIRVRCNRESACVICGGASEVKASARKCSISLGSARDKLGLVIAGGLQLKSLSPLLLLLASRCVTAEMAACRQHAEWAIRPHPRQRRPASLSAPDLQASGRPPDTGVQHLST
jgi:hypothetical protein